MVRIKICGITNLNDAIMAESFGADALGFIFYPASKRFIEAEKAKSIIEQLNPFISKVGVFVNKSVEEINMVSQLCGLTHVQLHGEESVESVVKPEIPVIKALSYDENLDSQLKVWVNFSLLIDSGNKIERGGTGKTLPWKSLAPRIKNKKIILAGGLTADNVVEAIKIIKPLAVDVSSGVEKSPGIKDPIKLKKFIERVREINEIL